MDRRSSKSNRARPPENRTAAEALVELGIEDDQAGDGKGIHHYRAVATEGWWRLVRSVSARLAAGKRTVSSRRQRFCLPAVAPPAARYAASAFGIDAVQPLDARTVEGCVDRNSMDCSPAAAPCSAQRDRLAGSNPAAPCTPARSRPPPPLRARVGSVMPTIMRRSRSCTTAGSVSQPPSTCRPPCSIIRSLLVRRRGGRRRERSRDRALLQLLGVLHDLETARR